MGVAGLPLATPSLLWRLRAEYYYRRAALLRMILKDVANDDLPCAF